MHKILCFLCIILSYGLYATPGFAQTMYSTDIFPPSPNAAALGRYGDVPVSLYTGIPNVEIPLYTVATKQHKLAIALSYHASGIKLAEEASLVGLGWALQAGGVITRSVRGTEDLSQSPNGYPFSGPLPPSTADNRYNPDDPAANHDIRTGDGAYFESTCRNDQDIQPDVFYFNFNGRSGKFLLDKSLSSAAFVTRIVSKSDKLKIEGIKQFDGGKYGWLITTEDGYKYRFGDVERTRVTVYSQSPPSGETATAKSHDSSWYLSSIESPNGEKILFTYATTDAKFYPTRSASRKQSCGRELVTNGCGDTESETVDNTTTTRFESESMGIKVLSRIDYAGGAIVFDIQNRSDIAPLYSNQKAKKIGGFTVYNTQGPPTPIRKYLFKQSYFDNMLSSSYSTAAEPPVTDNDSYAYRRLRLDEVQEIAGGISKPAHVFGYHYSTQSTAEQLPKKDSYAKDRYGFFNGAFSNDNPSVGPIPEVLGVVVPFLDIPTNPPFNVRGANVTPALAYLQIGTLNHITYPTKGSTEFAYELHRYYDGDTNQELAECGLRIARLETRSQKNEKPRIKTYVYTDPANQNRSSGVKMAPDNFYYFESSAYLVSCSPGPWPWSPDAESKYRFWRIIRSSDPALPLGSAAQGSPVGYSIVTEKDGFLDASNALVDNQNGKTEYYYFNDAEVVNYNQFIPNTPHEHPIKNGSLLKQIAYKTNAAKASGYQKLSEQTHEYSLSEVVPVKGAVMSEVICTNSVPVTRFLIDVVNFYSNNTYWLRKAATIEKVYDQQDDTKYVESRTNFEYSPVHRQLTKEQRVLADGTTLSTYYKYPADYTSLSAGAVYEMGHDRHMHSSVVEKITTTQKGTVEKVIAGAFSLYGKQNERIYQVAASSWEHSQALPLSAFKQSTPDLTTDSRYVLKQTFGYDLLSGNPTLQQTTDGIANSVQWGYRNLWPVAKFENANTVSRSIQLPGSGAGIANNYALGNECGYAGFESRKISFLDNEPYETIGGVLDDESHWSTNVSLDAQNYFTPQAHTGQSAWRVGPAPAWNYTYGPGRLFSPDGQKKRYKLSAWVKTEPGFLADAGALVMSVNRENGSFANFNGCYVQVRFGNTAGQWHYVEAFIDLAIARQNIAAATGTAVPEAERLQIMAYCLNQGANGQNNTAGFAIDDVRFHPADATATTYTYNVLGLPTSVSDQNNRPTFFEYDALGRLLIVRDHNRHILKTNTYHYQQ